MASSKLKKSKRKSLDAQHNTINMRQTETEQEISMKSSFNCYSSHKEMQVSESHPFLFFLLLLITRERLRPEPSS